MSEKKSEILCFCNGVSFGKVEQAIQQKCFSLAAIYDKTGAGTGPCGGSCRDKILALVEKTRHPNPKTSNPASSGLEVPYALVEAISLFNRRYYWETHEVLEHVWMEENGHPKKFYQGLIQASAALYHVLNANPKGVIRLAEEAVNKLKPYFPGYMDVPLEGLCASLESYAEEARQILGKSKSGFNYDALPYLLRGHEMDVPPAFKK